MRSNIFRTLGAATLLSVSSVAVAQSVAPLSLASSPSVGRVGADIEGESNLGDRRRGAGFYIIGAIVLGLIIWGIVELTDDDGPSSP